jgi:hypothetical protein
MVGLQAYNSLFFDVPIFCRMCQSCRLGDFFSVIYYLNYNEKDTNSFVISYLCSIVKKENICFNFL